MSTKSTSCGNEKNIKLAEEIFGLDLCDALGKCIEQGSLAFKAVVFRTLICRLIVHILWKRTKNYVKNKENTKVKR